jgi:cellulose synthase/poly-beta-1,6-N-acetylglucosamine synthase-like glycosyltransferase
MAPDNADPYELLKLQLVEEYGSEHETHTKLEAELDEFIEQVMVEDADANVEAAQPREKVALLIAAHNEELVIENTIRSAIRSGQPREHIYVVDDNSTDATSKLARGLLPRKNVKKVGRSGKGLALMRGTAHFNLTKRYEWVHIADADGSFSADYFDVLKRELDPSHAAVTGYIKSQPGGIISQCRVYEYTIGMEMMRRFQTLFGVIPIIPGATSCFRSDVFEKVDFNAGSMTEDFDVTVQIHRQKLGKIQFVPGITALTQDPKDLGDYVKQVERWNRGFMQVMQRHNLGMRLGKIDAYIAYQLAVSFFYAVNFFIFVPAIIFATGNWVALAVMFVADVIFTFSMVVAAASASKRWDILSAFPNIYAMRWLNMYLFFKAVFEVFILRRHKLKHGIWGTEGRRYKPTMA